MNLNLSLAIAEKKIGFYKSRHKAEHEQEAKWAHKTSPHLPFREMSFVKEEFWY